MNDLVLAIVGGTCLGILLACFDNWFNDRQRRRRHNRKHH